MIDSTTLAMKVYGYMNYCKSRQQKPTYHGLADVLQASTMTIYNVVHGSFNGGKRYTEHPHKTRIIDNPDFEIIQNVFREGK